MRAKNEQFFSHYKTHMHIHVGTNTTSWNKCVNDGGK